jgi:small subunit ribosomal protein S18
MATDTRSNSGGGDRSGGGERRPSGPRGKGFPFKRIKKKRCKLCTQKLEVIDFKNTDFIRNYITERGKIIPRRISGCCAKHQRLVMRTIKKSREAGFVPFAAE